MRRFFPITSVLMIFVLFCASGLALQTAPGQGPIPAPKDEQAALPAGVASDWRSQAQANIQKEEYNITWQDETILPDAKAAWQAPNRAQGFRTYFTEDGIRVVPRAGEKPEWE